MSFHCIFTTINEFIFISLNHPQFNLKRNLCISKTASPKTAFASRIFAIQPYKHPTLSQPKPQRPIDIHTMHTSHALYTKHSTAYERHDTQDQRDAQWHICCASLPNTRPTPPPTKSPIPKLLKHAVGLRQITR